MSATQIKLERETMFKWKKKYEESEKSNEILRKRVSELERVVSCCKNDYWFMVNLIESYGSDKDQTLKDCAERMKFRQPMFKQLTQAAGEE